MGVEMGVKGLGLGKKEERLKFGKEKDGRG